MRLEHSISNFLPAQLCEYEYTVDSSPVLRFRLSLVCQVSYFDLTVGHQSLTFQEYFNPLDRSRLCLPYHQEVFRFKSFGPLIEILNKIQSKKPRFKLFKTQFFQLLSINFYLGKNSFKLHFVYFDTLRSFYFKREEEFK